MAMPEPRGEFTLSVADVRQIARRRMWWFLVPSALGMLISGLLALLWPATYSATSVVGIDPQGIPENLVESTIVSDAETRYGQIRLRILSRDNLSDVIETFNLFPDDSRPREELVEDLRSRISITPGAPAIVKTRGEETIQSFLISFEWDSPDIVAQVANQLTRDFLSQNLKDRAGMAEGTSQFLRTELRKVTEESERLAKQISGFKEQHQGRLPEDLPGNTHRLDRLRLMHAQNLSEYDIARGNIERIKEQIEIMREAGGSSDDDPVRRKKSLELQLGSLRAAGMTDKHPDVMAALTEIAALEVRIEEEGDGPTTTSPTEAALRSRLGSYQVESQATFREMERMEAEMSELEARIEATPKLAAELTQMESNHDSLVKAIDQLKAKQVSADMARSKELAQKGERFRIVEQAEVPVNPTSPNRPLFVVVGLVLGVGIGLFMATVRELADQSFHTAADLQSTVGLPVLGSIPVIELPQEVAATRARLRRLVITGLVLMGLAAGGSLAFYFTMQAFEGSRTATPAEQRGAHV